MKEQIIAYLEKRIAILTKSAQMADEKGLADIALRIDARAKELENALEFVRALE